MENTIASVALDVDTAGNIQALPAKPDMLPSTLDQHPPPGSGRIVTGSVRILSRPQIVSTVTSIPDATATFYHDKIAACGQHSKSLFRIIENIIGRYGTRHTCLICVQQIIW